MSGAKYYLLIWAVLVVSSCYFLQALGEKTTDPSEVSALKAIRNALIDPMKHLNTWASGDPCTSNWKGISCEASSDDGYLHIQVLLLLKLNLSGTLAPELGILSHLKILDVMWNNINGSIPKEIGNITSLRLLLLNGNRLSGSLPEEIGYLPNLDRIQIDENQISGTIPKSFANLNRTRHFHLNNNSLSGQIPPELSKLPSVVHLLLDNNNLSGYLPPEFSSLPHLQILQLDNNHFSGSFIPASYGNISTLQKLSLRNCSLQGTIPDLSSMSQLLYLDLSGNQLNGSIPSKKLSSNITTIDLSNNLLYGSIPTSFSGLPNLQRLSLDNNLLSGSFPSSIWQNMTFHGNKSLILNFQNNSLTDISNDLNPPANVTVLLYGNPLCSNVSQISIFQFCQPKIITQTSGSSVNSKINCGSCPTDMNYEHNPLSPLSCLCAVPIGVGFRLKSPGISDFQPYIDNFEIFLTSHLNVFLYQLYIDSFAWEEGRRLRMKLKFFPNNVSLFDVSEILRIRAILTGWEITLPGIFGPYEILDFTLGYYENVMPKTTASGLKKGAILGIVFGSMAGAATVSALITILIMKRHCKYKVASRKHTMSKNGIKINGVKGFTFRELELATNNFSNSMKVGQGGYGNVYRGILSDGTLVAIKRAHAGSLQGSKEFFTEIELLSRLHHRNLVSLVGYCDESEEQMLVYEFMPNGTLRDHLSTKSEDALSFPMRLHIALGSARGILYLHTEVDPPIFHRDIKASNILLDSKFTAKVADFGLSRLAPVPNLDGTNPGYVSTVVKGTPGYLDPEYFLTHKLTDKSDVYSLGVVFLELLTGRPPIAHGKNIVREVSTAYHSGAKFSVIDNRMGPCPPECIEKFASLALKCCEEETNSRPSMSEVVRDLENIWHMVPEADATLSESMVTDSVSTSAAPSSTFATRYTCVSSDVSGSDISSNITSNVAPR